MTGNQRRTERRGAGFVCAFLLVASIPFTVSAQQTLEQRVAAVGSGTVRFSYAAKEGVCGNGQGGNISYRTQNERARDSARASEWENDCEPGPVRLSLDVENRRVTRVRAYVGGRWRGEVSNDLGEIPAMEARAYLLQLAGNAEERVGKDAIFPALMADAPAPDRELLALAKDENRPRQVRTTATFWLAQSAGERVSAGLQELTNDSDRQVRESAVFSLSQRPNEESVPALIRLARTHNDPSIRRNAMFWLGQKQDPRALAYLEEVLAPR